MYFLANQRKMFSLEKKLGFLIWFIVLGKYKSLDSIFTEQNRWASEKVLLIWIIDDLYFLPIVMPLSIVP